MATKGERDDVLVIGGGLAALCAAISARQAGVSVVMAEAAPRELRGGNTRHSRNLRIMHAAPSAALPGAYSEAEFLADLAKASKGAGDPALARQLVRQSALLPDWLAASGVVFQSKHIPFSRKTAFFLGGGKTAINALYAFAERLGVRIVYGHPVDAVRLSGGDAGPSARAPSSPAAAASRPMRRTMGSSTGARPSRRARSCARCSPKASRPQAAPRPPIWSPSMPVPPLMTAAS